MTFSTLRLTIRRAHCDHRSRGQGKLNSIGSAMHAAYPGTRPVLDDEAIPSWC